MMWSITLNFSSRQTIKEFAKTLNAFKTVLSTGELQPEQIDFPLFEPFCKLLLKLRQHAASLGSIEPFVKALNKHMEGSASPLNQRLRLVSPSAATYTFLLDKVFGSRAVSKRGMYRLHQKARQGSSVDLEAKLNPPYVCSALSQKVQLSLERRHVDAALTEACRTAQKAGNQSVRAGVLQWIKPF